MKRDGFTLIEFLITSVIVIIALGALIILQRDLLTLNLFFEEGLSIQRDAELVVNTAVAELRSASQSSIGAYPVEVAASSSLAFYSDIDSDPLKERVHYFLSGRDLWKSVIKPAGQPLTYSTSSQPIPAAETLMVVLRNVVASSTVPIFSYYGGTYTGTSTPLFQPVNILNVRHVGIKVIVDSDPLRVPPAIIIGSEVTIRNLKDNL